MGKHRTPEERLKEARLKVEALEAKANRRVLAKDPQVAALDKEIAALNQNALKWKRWEKEADEKIQNFKDRVSTWEERKIQASGFMDDYRKTLADLKQERESALKEALKTLESEA